MHRLKMGETTGHGVVWIREFAKWHISDVYPNEWRTKRSAYRADLN